MSTDTSQQGQVPPPGSAPAAMPPPAPGTGLTDSAPAPPQVQETAPAPSRERQPDPAPRPVTTGGGPSLGRRLVLGAVWGPIAVGAAAALQMWSSALSGDEAIRPLRMMTAVLEGGAGLVDGSPLVGIGINVGIGIVVGIVFALIAGALRTARSTLVTALFLGAGVFALDHYLLGPELSEVFELREESFLLATRLVMGAVLAIGFLTADRD